MVSFDQLISLYRSSKHSRALMPRFISKDYGGADKLLSRSLLSGTNLDPKCARFYWTLVQASYDVWPNPPDLKIK